MVNNVSLKLHKFLFALFILLAATFVQAQQNAKVAGASEDQLIKASGEPAQLDIRVAGENSIRVTLKPISYKDNFPFNPGVAAWQHHLLCTGRTGFQKLIRFGMRWPVS